MKSNAVESLMLGLEREIGWQTGVLLRGVNIKRVGHHYRMTITVTTTKGAGLVTFIEGHSIYRCYEVLATALYTNSLTLKWYTDRYFGS